MTPCVLHIGTEKTATTTLQRFLDRERVALSSEGMVVTSAAGVGNNWRLAVAAYDDDRRDDRSVDAGVGDAESRVRFRADLTAALGAELLAGRQALQGARGAAGGDTVVFSSEHLHSRLTRPSELDRLAEMLTRLGLDATDTRIILYLRDPVALAASLHSTVVKHGSTRSHPPPPDPGTYYHHVCDHRSSIERWAAVFPNVTPRLFTPDALVGGSIVADFCDAIGVTVPSTRASADGVTEFGHLNRSLSTAEVAVLSRINERIPYAVDGRPNPTHAALVDAIERHSTGPGYRLPAPLASRYREAFADSNEWVRRRFFPDRRHLFPAEDPEHRTSTAGPGYDGLAALVAELAELAERAGPAEMPERDESSAVGVDGGLHVVESAE